MRYLLLSVFLFYTHFSFSQEEIQKDSIQQLGEVVISAQYSPRSEKNSIYKVKVLHAKTIENKAANNLRELLQQELNLDLSQNSVFGSSIELQGLSKENIKILVDGTPVIGRLNGVIDLSQINLQNIERVEIIEGPVSVFYGTDAMGGIINLISKTNQFNKVEGDISMYYESIKAMNINGNIGFKTGKNTFKINIGNYLFNGISTNDSPRNLNWEKKKQYFGSFLYNRKFSKLNVTYKANFSNEELNNIGEPNRFGKIQDKDYFSRRIDNTLNLEGEVFATHFLKMHLSYLDYQRYHNTFNIDPTSFEATISEDDNKNDNVVSFNYAGFKTQIGKGKSDEVFGYALGTDINQESTEGVRILDNKQTILTAAFFGSVNYKLIQNIEIQPALRYTYNDSYGSLVSPAFNSKIKINNTNTIRLSYARGFRAPSLKELFLDFHIKVGPNTYIITGNENLDVEKSHSFNLQYSFAKVFDNDLSFKVEPSLFYNAISNLIALSDMVHFKRNYININQFKSKGGKISFSIKKNNQFSIKTGVSITGRYNKFTEDFSSEKFLYAPEISTNLSYQINNTGIDLAAYYKFTGERFGFFIEEDNGSLVKTTRESFHNLDLSISKKFFNNMFKTALGVRNAFDVQDVETINRTGEAHSRDMQLWGRSFYIKTAFFF